MAEPSSQSKTEPSQEPTPDPSQEPTSTDKDETKRKFRAALAAKQGRHGEDHIDNTRAHPDAHGPVNEKRTFRRKTG